ncbi:hypothetical protein P5W04_10360 [Mycobacteroides abscessus subsp. abscessus]|uniref:hypothetical protein n=1 Tax=Mycobacteroides abscessus TaxID=36809 RepID=UPI000E6A5750|nr:hypothetical protein [Mycobacteroides abscessus]MBN7484541.1 hypothetical protein [Mycobacteroides abscessus subsp. abscessus]MDO3240517.1 hypothetical protein [Mycobacteroides abscessus subsp. abscessus]RIT75012.1 hypothetical protein D2E77_01640 [Mycobacteroides abscessus]
MQFIKKHPWIALTCAVVVVLVVIPWIGETGSSAARSSTVKTARDTGSSVLMWVLILAVVGGIAWFFLRRGGGFGGPQMVGQRELQEAQRELYSAIETVRHSHAERMRREMDRLLRERAEVLDTAKREYEKENGAWV